MISKMRKCVIHNFYKYEFCVFNRRIFSGRRKEIENISYDLICLKLQKASEKSRTWISEELQVFGRTIISSAETLNLTDGIIFRPNYLFGRKYFCFFFVGRKKCAG